jgi:hypothetical protein
LVKKQAPAAKANQKGENISGYFRKILERRPNLLDSGSNRVLLEQWLKDHPDEREVPNRVKNVLSNLKSILRKKRRRKRPAQQAAERSVEKVSPVGRTATRALESLEERIDDCMTLGRSIEGEALEEIIKLLRIARNKVVWALGQ